MTDLDSRGPALAPTAPPPGWYPDAYGDTRWWDGAAWTGHVQPAGPASSSAEAEPIVEHPEPLRPPGAAAAVAETVPPVPPALPEGPADEVYANAFEAAVATRVVSEAAVASAPAVGPATPVDPDSHPAVVVHDRQVTPSPAAGIQGPSRGGSVVLLLVSLPAAAWGAVSLLAVVLRGTDALGLVRTPLALVCVAAGGWVALQAAVGLRRGERAQLPDPVVDAAETVAGADRRVLALAGVAVAVVAVSVAVGPISDEAPPPAAAPAVVALPAPKGFTSLAGEVAYRMTPTTKGCPLGSVCRTVEMVALVPCTDLSAVVVFRDRFGGGLGTSLLQVPDPTPGKRVALTASVRDPAATRAAVTSMRCGTV